MKKKGAYGQGRKKVKGRAPFPRLKNRTKFKGMERIAATGMAKKPIIL
jgi:hypothetical protein